MQLALPLMASNFLQTLYNLTDTWFLGRLDAVSLSAPGVAMPLVWLVVVFSNGFSTAGITLMSQSKGKGSMEKVELYLGQLTLCMLVLSIVLGGAGVMASPAFLTWMGTPPELEGLANAYLRIIFSGMPFLFITVVLQAAYQAVGNGIIPLVVQGISVGLNVLLDPLFIFGLGPMEGMGVAGAAWATLLARSLAAVVSIGLLIHPIHGGPKLRWKTMRPRRSPIALLLRVGLPASMGHSLTALGFTVLQGVINSFGTAVIAAFSIGNRLIGLFNMPAMGISQATAALVGQELGAGRRDGANQVLKTALLTIFTFLITSMTLTFFFGNHFTRFFVDDPQVVAYGADLFRYVSASVVFFGLFTVFGGAFQGGGDTRSYMVLNVLRLWGVRLPLAWLFGQLFDWGPTGVWIAMCSSNMVVFMGAILVHKRGKWQQALRPDEL